MGMNPQLVGADKTPISTRRPSHIPKTANPAFLPEQLILEDDSHAEDESDVEEDFIVSTTTPPSQSELVRSKEWCSPASPRFDWPRMASITTLQESTTWHAVLPANQPSTYPPSNAPLSRRCNNYTRKTAYGR
ncbi:uncharacterized protein N7458_005986 [Penicillium daleae]|uniref:Uncharacterized protein n=1 Tax=Penicillium daleae TaxID=63821 RepID=A0AAD6C3F9_9EURO|nr:uncharacterized protein N7458_005986 [Penicillium daleae]KAJ5449537.1 hypothetical protein N7458_005986 [Penicillium daleae]